MSAFVDDRDRDQCIDLGGALVCGGDDCVSLLERERHRHPFDYMDRCPCMNKRIVETARAQGPEAKMVGRWTTPPRQVGRLALAVPTRGGRGSDCGRRSFPPLCRCSAT